MRGRNMLIEWNEDLTTGNRTIDEQHRELIDRFNGLLAACNQGKGKEEIKSLL
jgi:hemerythrin